MTQKEFKTNCFSDSGLLSLVCAVALATMGGCGDQVAPASDVAVAASSPSAEAIHNQKFVELFKKAEAGDAEAQFGLASAYLSGEGIAKDAAKAAEWYQKAVALGHLESHARLGRIYQLGEGVPKDLSRAFDLFTKASEKGNTNAQIFLADMYFKGVGIDKDLLRATKLYESAAISTKEPGVTWLMAGQFYNGIDRPKDIKTAIKLYEISASRGYAESQKVMGNMYLKGNGIKKNNALAAEWFEKAALQGDIESQLQIGRMYYNGIGLPKSEYKAFEWLKKAAIQGNTKAQGMVGSMYLMGKGTQTDLVLGYAWINIASISGDNELIIMRNNLDKQLESKIKMEAQQVASNWKKSQTLTRKGIESNADSSVQVSSNKLIKQGNGTIFFVSKSGQAITNYHVINGCKEIRIAGREGILTVSTTDPVNDLALLQVPGAINVIASINAEQGKTRQGDDVVVFGYPLNSVLSSGGNLTPGIVSALTGLDNNTNQLQITAPIQPGSSGSPVMNKKGEIVGVVSMKLSDSKMAKATGQVAQNVNFAVSGQTLKSFLDAHKVEYSTGGMMSFAKSTADIADEARKWTSVVECWK